MFNEWEENARKARRLYPEGTRIELINMKDPYHPVASGTRGTVDFIDDAGQIFMNWDNGRGLAIVPEVDEFRKLTPEEIEKENLSEQYVRETIQYCSEGNMQQAYESWSKLYDLYTAPEDAPDNVHMANSRQLFRYTAMVDDKTVYAVTEYGKNQSYQRQGYYDDVSKDEPDICE